MGERRGLVTGIALLVVPLLGAVVSLFAGLAVNELALVYVSIGLSAVAMPAMIGGVILVVRALTSKPGR